MRLPGIGAILRSSLRQALRQTAAYLERREQTILRRWSQLLQADQPRSIYGDDPESMFAGGRQNLHLLVAALRADTPDERQALQDAVFDWGNERARWGLDHGLDVRDLLEPLARFRVAVQENVQRMLARRFWIALPSDVLTAVTEINSAIDVQMNTISEAYLAAREEIITTNEGALAASNRQLVLLNQEMQHRIKNNLQAVADLLSLELAQGMRKEPAEYLQESLGRVKCIAAVHTLLSPDNAQTTDAAELAAQVADIAVRGLAGAQPVRVTVDGPPLPLPPKQATSLALVLNELVSNSIEHGFAGKGGTIDVQLAVEGQHGILTVHDNGAGLPEGFAVDRDQNLGLRIVRALIADDLKGDLTLTSDTGAVASVRFPIPSVAK